MSMPVLPRWKVFVSLVVVAAAVACVEPPPIDTSVEAARKIREQSLGTLPYHPLVYHMDLSILAYQLYSQSLVWPFDPYYEDVDDDDVRDALMDRVREWVDDVGSAQVMQEAGLEAYRGPGALNGFENNAAHDPIIYQYSRIYPWSTGIANASGEWVEYRTPTQVTDRIRDVFVCRRAIDTEDTVEIDAMAGRRADVTASASDALLVFEGGTGDKGEPGQAASQSLMGFALVREHDQGYDVHISFRGSRSGVAERAAIEAISTEDASGNPDWITDLGYAEVEAPDVSTVGEVSRGMSRAVQLAVPQLFACLDAQVGAPRDQPPQNIYLTGHSLGGGIAQHLASALLMGDTYTPEGDVMPASLRAWPWRNLKLITYGAPRVGNEEWAAALTETELESTLFEKRTGAPFDVAAVGITDLDILPRAIDVDRPAAFRVLIPTDPITTGFIAGGEHVGQTVYVEQPTEWDATATPDFDAHEPEQIRDRMVDTLRDDRIPDEAWAYLAMRTLNPSRDEDDRGSEDEYEKLAQAVRDYHDDNDMWFALDAFDAGVVEFISVLTE